MTTIDWPSVLSSPLLGTSYDFEAVVAATEMESGRYRQRRRFTRQRKAYDAKFYFNDGELLVFESFVKHILENGALSFNIDLPLATVGLVATEVQIVRGIYSVDVIAPGLKNQVDLTLIAQDNNTLTSDSLIALLDSEDGGLSFIEAASSLDAELDHFENEHGS